MWLLEQNVFQSMQLARGNVISAEQQAQFQARDHSIQSAADSKDGSATINIKGVLTENPDIMAEFFGGGNTTYPSIIDAIARAELDTSVSSITYVIDSPGGTISGLFEAIAAMQSVKKPTKVIVKGMCASAAYALATQADSISASSVASMVGSVGVVIDFYVYENEKSITNTASPKKRPDITTEEGEAVVVEGLDAAYELFADAIAVGRSTTIEKINANFGQGATLLAGEALKRGMIDAINQPALKAVTTKAAHGGKSTETVMDLNTLKAQHADVYKAALAEGEQIGVIKERDRVNAHLIAGEMSGRLESAVKAAKEGDEMTQTASMTYMMAAANKGDINARDGDNLDTSDTQGAVDDAKAQSEKILATAFESLGVEV